MGEENGMWYIYEKDKNDNVIHAIRYDKFEVWKEFDEDSRMIYRRNSRGEEYWWKYDKHGEIFLTTKKEFDRIKAEKEFLSREEVLIFELMEI